MLAKSAGWGEFVTGALSKRLSERSDLQGRPWLACERWPCGSSEAGGCCPPAWGCSTLASRNQRHEGCCKPLPSSTHRTTTTDPAPSSIATADTVHIVTDEASSRLPKRRASGLQSPVLLRQLSICDIFTTRADERYCIMSVWQPLTLHTICCLLAATSKQLRCTAGHQLLPHHNIACCS